MRTISERGSSPSWHINLSDPVADEPTPLNACPYWAEMICRHRGTAAPFLFLETAGWLDHAPFTAPSQRLSLAGPDHHTNIYCTLDSRELGLRPKDVVDIHFCSEFAGIDRLCAAAL